MSSLSRRLGKVSPQTRHPSISEAGPCGLPHSLVLQNAGNEWTQEKLTALAHAALFSYNLMRLNR